MIAPALACASHTFDALETAPLCQGSKSQRPWHVW